MMNNSEKFENEGAGQNTKISWDKDAQENFKRLINKIPIFLRPIAEKKVSKIAEANVINENRLIVVEKDLVDAFFSETPFGFHGPMKNDMDEIHIDYTKYGYPK